MYDTAASPRARGDAPSTFALWSLRDDVELESRDRGHDLIVHSLYGELRLRRPDPLLRTALDRMTFGPISLENVFDMPPGRLGADASHPVLWPTLNRLRHLLVRSLGVDDPYGPFLSAVPVSTDAVFRPYEVEYGVPIALAPDASWERCTRGKGLKVRTPDGPFLLVLHRPEAIWTAMAITHPVSVDQVLSQLPITRRLAREIIGYIGATSLLSSLPGGRGPSGSGGGTALTPS
ncbi:hypothetical protein ACFT8P_35665 [Streptomyces sp. NPDC057101]|uniref:hypothetical protein n=1 Tax=Streptomyces sp. NPDC057101 TaxID=3346020 RepID=UPI00363DB625